MAFESLRIFPSEEYSNRNHCHTLWPFLSELTKVVRDVPPVAQILTDCFVEDQLIWYVNFSISFIIAFDIRCK
jgi:hypothetical protein